MRIRAAKVLSKAITNLRMVIKLTHQRLNQTIFNRLSASQDLPVNSIPRIGSVNPQKI